MPKTSFYSGTGITSEKADAVESSANAAAQSAADAATSETNAATSEANALTSETNASSSAANSLTSETNAAASEANALASATSAQNLEITSASFDTTDGTLTLTKANSGTVTTDLDGRFLTSYTEANDLSTAVTWADVPDENITESSVTQHQSAINAGVSITESQISNLQSYLTAETSHADVLVDGDFTSNGLMKRDGAGTYSVDTSTYLTTHQDITGKADLSGADFTGDVTTTGDLGINTTNPAHPLDVKGNVNVTYGTDPIYTTSPLLTNASNTTYSIAEITDIYYASVRSTINQSPLGAWNDNRRAVQILFNFNGTGHPTAGQKGWASADQSVVGDFINDTYSSNDISTFQSSLTAIFNGTYTLQTTIIDDILDGDYDHLVDYKVGINTDPATEALDVGGNIKASGTLATGGYTLASTDGTNGQALLTDGSGNVSFGDVTGTGDVSGKADLSGADFTGDVSVAGTFNTNNIESTINTVDYPVYSTSLDGSNAIATLGGTSTGDKVHTLEMRPAAGGVRMHWHQGGLYDGIAGTSDTTDTLRFHTTDRGIHVGDDSVGTYTAGDNQNNADVDFGMLVGRSSTNIGTNNFGFGHGLSFNSSDIASCLGAGTSITFQNKTQSSIGMGADVTVGEYNTPTGDPTRKAIFAGGNVVTGSGEYSFTWAKGDYGGGGQNGLVRYSASNLGTGCVLFGYQTKILSTCNYSFNGGSRGLSGDYKHQRLNDCDYTISWGFQNETDRSDSTAVFGQGNDVADSSTTIVAGLNNIVEDSKYASVTGFANASYCYGGVIGGQSNIVGKDVVDNTDGKYSACFGFDNLVESDGNFVSGYENNTLGHSSACIGRGLKTPLFQPNGGGDYVWDDYSITVGAYNAEATKYYTNTANTAWVKDHRFVVGTGTSVNAKDNGFIVAVPDSGFCGIIMPNLASSPDYASASAAKAGGVPVGGLYRIGSDVKILLSTD